MYVSNNERPEFELFIYEHIGRYLKSQSVKMHGFIHTFTLYKEQLQATIDLLKVNNIKSYKILETDEADFDKDIIKVKYLEQYPIDDERERKRFSEIRSRIMEWHLHWSSVNIYNGNLDDFNDIDTGERFSYFILDRKHLDDVRNIVRHVLKIEIDINHVDVKNDDYGINGLIWFKVPNINYYPKKSYTSTYEILCLLGESQINHCIYNDRDGKFTLDIRMKEKDNRHSEVKFRTDLGLVFRSTWEANFARLLNYLDINWGYEQDSFLVESDYLTTNYLPDFFLEGNTIVELKGFWDTDSLKKVSLFKEQYQDYRLITIDADMYYTLDKLYGEKIKKWENSTINRNKERVAVVGITRPERREYVSNIKIGDELLLIRDASNPYDQNAILVVNNEGNSIGFISKDWASIYTDKIDLGMKFKATVKEKKTKVIKIDLERVNYEENSLYTFLMPQDA
ncbi:HIRAN domain-containing protein [Ornithinibacillus californiensis]|uniref:HIRAN domain-containing protein n=1 Tax=Ornithinibacillus californiensis TaxID=161536 RepID=UPI00064DEE55|nr:HIRAN domain-containing protein [Ornithinibacillus californiensis]